MDINCLKCLTTEQKDHLIAEGISTLDEFRKLRDDQRKLQNSAERWDTKGTAMPLQPCWPCFDIESAINKYGPTKLDEDIVDTFTAVNKVASGKF